MLDVTEQAQRIPLSDHELLMMASSAKNLLPQQWRAPLPMDVIAIDDLALEGLQTIDGEPGQIGMRVLVAGQSDGRLNGPYLMQDKAWKRMSAPTPGGSMDGDPKGPTLAYRASYRINRGSHAQRYFWITSVDAILVGVSLIEISYLGRNLFDPIFVEAEKQIFLDMDRNHTPILPTFLANPGQLTNAKAFKALSILYQEAITGGVSGQDLDRHERQAKYWGSRYEGERTSTLLRLIDGARQQPRRRRAIRG